MTWPGMARRVGVRRGTARHGPARPGPAWRGLVRLAEAGLGLAWQGRAGQGESRPSGAMTAPPSAREATAFHVDHGPVTPATFRAVHDAYVRQVTAGLVEHINSSQPTPTEMLTDEAAR